MTESPIYAAQTDRTNGLVSRREGVLGRPYRLLYDRPVEFVRGSGVTLWTETGEQFLDAYNNVQVAGHSHPAVADAVARAVATLNTNTRYLAESTVAYAEELLATFPARLDRIVFTCTGSEANDLAVRVAREATGNTGVIVTEHAYHGNTDLVSGLSPALVGTDAVPAEVRTVPAPHDGGARFVEGVARAIAELDAAGHGTAALLVDTVFSSDGVFPAAGSTFLGEAAALVRAAGGVLIADEVQPGFGRLGDGMWGFDAHATAPEIVTLGKPMGNGYPVAAVVAGADLFETFGTRRRYFNTFGGTNVAIAAATATLQAIRNDGLIENARWVGETLRTGLDQLVRDGGTCLDSVRGNGLFFGVDIAPGHRAVALVNALRERGILIGLAGPRSDVLKIRPPLPFSGADAERLLDALAEAGRA